MAIIIIIIIIKTWQNLSRCKLTSDGLIEHGLTSPPTHWLYGRRFYRSEDPTNSIKVLKEHKEYTIHKDYFTPQSNSSADSQH